MVAVVAVVLLGLLVDAVASQDDARAAVVLVGIRVRVIFLAIKGMRRLTLVWTIIQQKAATLVLLVDHPGAWRSKT